MFLFQYCVELLGNKLNVNGAHVEGRKLKTFVMVSIFNKERTNLCNAADTAKGTEIEFKIDNG